MLFRLFIFIKISVVIYYCIVTNNQFYIIIRLSLYLIDATKLIRTLTSLSRNPFPIIYFHQNISSSIPRKLYITASSMSVLCHPN